MSEAPDKKYCEDLMAKIPPALYDKVSEELRKDGCYGVWNQLLECVSVMKETWEDENGENLIWIPGHYEKSKT